MLFAFIWLFYLLVLIFSYGKNSTSQRHERIRIHLFCLRFDVFVMPDFCNYPVLVLFFLFHFFPFRSSFYYTLFNAAAIVRLKNAIHLCGGEFPVHRFLCTFKYFPSWWHEHWALWNTNLCHWLRIERDRTAYHFAVLLIAIISNLLLFSGTSTSWENDDRFLNSYSHGSLVRRNFFDSLPSFMSFLNHTNRVGKSSVIWQCFSKEDCWWCRWNAWVLFFRTKNSPFFSSR